jgi:acetate kinase
MTKKLNILVINCGSSSLKFAVINEQNGEVALSGLAERLGSEDASITFKNQGNKQTQSLTTPFGHTEAISSVVEMLSELDLSNTLSAIGHRVVHGGEAFTESAVITKQVIAAIKHTSNLAPLHNPANLLGIKAAKAAFPDLPQVAVFDTAFHQTMPEKAYMYAIDKDLYEEFGIRRYGFHGTSHYFVAQQAANMLKQPIEETSIITIHLGNGCSISAIELGQSVDTSLGMTPVEGLVMGTRSGDIDPGLIVYLMKQHNYTADQIDNLINKQSGLLGLSKLSNDCRTLEEAISDNDPQRKQSAKLAMDVFCYRVAKYIASFTVPLSKLDGIVFTGGIGENSDYVRREVCRQLSLLGIKLDDNRNLEARFGQDGFINSDDSRFKVMVIPTNEEWVIAQDSARLTR